MTDTLRFDELELVEKLNQLEAQLKAAFAAACAQRLLTAYDTFVVRTGRGDSRALKEIISHLWADLASKSRSDMELNEQIESCMKIIPREDDDNWVTEQAGAEDAVSALVYALRCHRSGKSEEAAWAARRAYEALDHLVINYEKIDVNVAGAEARIVSNPLIQTELTRQNRDLDELLRGQITVDTLRERSKAEAMSFMP